MWAKKQLTAAWAALAVVASGAALVRAGDDHGHEGDFVVGRSDTGQILVEFDANEPYELPPVSGLLNGWALDDPGFMSLAEDEPDEGIFTLEPGASIALEVVAIDAALSAWTPGFADRLDAAGETWTIGGDEFDEHPTWHIDLDDPSFDPGQTSWSVTFRLLDQGATGYTASDDIAVSFVAVPEPGALALMVLGSVAAGLRRRGR